MDYINEGVEFSKAISNAATGLVAQVYVAVTSKKAQRTLLTTILAAVVSAVLFGFACLGYLAFYHEYLPDQVITVPVYLQYGYEINPYGVVRFPAETFGDYQEYDISVTLTLPRSPVNLERGNFMLGLHLLDTNPPTTTPRVAELTSAGFEPKSIVDGKNILFSSHRPAIVPYNDPLVSLASRLLFLAYHIFVPASETTKLVVPMMEKLEFRRGTMMPSIMVLDVQAGQRLQVYSVLVTFTAQLSGLRWFMHTWWITSFLIFATTFWICEVLFVILTVLATKLLFVGSGEAKTASVKNEQGQAIKQEGERGGRKLEDVPMTFPTRSQQPPLRYDPAPAHTNDVGPGTPQADMPPAAGGEADVEDEDEYGGEERDGEERWHDSGIGTSFSERDGSGSLRRRRSSGRVS